MMPLRRKIDKMDKLHCTPCGPREKKKKTLPLLMFSWNKCQYEDQSSANQLVFPCSSQENLTSAEQQEPVSQTNDR